MSFRDYCLHGTQLGTPCKSCDIENQYQARRDAELQAKLEGLARKAQSARDTEIEKLRAENAKLRAAVEEGMICEHGQLARQCDYCEKDREIAELRSENARLREALEKIRDEAMDLVEQVHGKHETGCDSYWTCNLCHADGSGILIREWAREALKAEEGKV